jgi:hypothetical protein
MQPQFVEPSKHPSTVRDRHSEVVGLTEQVILQVRQANTQLLGLSSEVLQARRETQAAVRRLSVLVLRLCCVAVSGLFLGWQFLRVADATLLVQTNLTETRGALQQVQTRLKVLEKLEVASDQHAKDLSELLGNYPRITTGAGQLLVEVPVSDAAARAAGKLTAPTSPPVGRKANLVITNGRVDFNER